MCERERSEHPYEEEKFAELDLGLGCHICTIQADRENLRWSVDLGEVLVSGGMTNSNEVRTARIGSFLLAVAALVVAPLAWSAARPSVPQDNGIETTVRLSQIDIVGDVPSTNTDVGNTVIRAVPGVLADGESTKTWTCERRDTGRFDLGTRIGGMAVPGANGKVRACHWE